MKSEILLRPTLRWIPALHFFRQRGVRTIALVLAVIVLRNQLFLLSLDDAKTELAVSSL
jgi:hypothetical protein